MVNISQMRKLFIIVVLAFAIIVPICAQDEVKRVAILKTVDEAGNVPLGVKLNLRSTLAYAISHMSGYEAYTRVNISEIMDEQQFQRTGYVSDSQIKKLGEMTGASYVLVAETGYYDENNIKVISQSDFRVCYIYNVAPYSIKSGALHDGMSCYGGEVSENGMLNGVVILKNNDGRCYLV